ncbi:MAG: CheR family methyltransferase [Candidatus Thorarchaeota archaeon]
MEDLEEWFSKSKRQRQRLSRHTAQVRHLWKQPSDSTDEKQEKTRKTGFVRASIRRTRSIQTRAKRLSAPSADQGSSSASSSDSAPPPFMKIRKIPDEDILPKLKQQLLQMGFDISSYKTNYLKRRLRVLLRRSNCATYSQYLEQLRKDPREVEKLKRTFSINVTRFFRNLDSFWAVQKIILPELLRIGPRRSVAKVWSAGCAMGPEPYTLAMLIHDYRLRYPNLRNARILGTDLNPDLLRIAEIAEYSSEAFEETPATFMSKYLSSQGEGRYRVIPAIRSMVHFQQHDLLSPISMGTQDLIVCRNVLIYFGKEQQEKIFSSFSRCLQDGGMLLLGRTESLPITARKEFEIVNGRHRIYRRAAAS